MVAHNLVHKLRGNRQLTSLSSHKRDLKLVYHSLAQF